MLPNLQQLAATFAAQAGAGSGGCAESNPIMLPVIMIGILYVVWILPSQRERKKHASMIETLKRGDEVVTNSGIFGTITDMTEKVFTIEIAKNVKIRVLKSAVSKRTTDDAPAAKPDEKKDEPTKPNLSKESKASKD